MWKWMNENSCAWKQTKVVCVCGGEEEGGAGSWLCHAYQAKLRQMQMRSLYSAGEEREKERWGVRTAGASCGKREKGKGTGRVATNTWGMLPLPAESWCCKLAAFGQQQKNIKAPFKGLAGSLLEGVGGDWERERGTGTYPQFAQPKMYRARNRPRGADRENYGHYVIKYLKCCHRMPMEKDSVPEILPTATTMEHAYVLTKEL